MYSSLKDALSALSIINELHISLKYDVSSSDTSFYQNALRKCNQCGFIVKLVIHLFKTNTYHTPIREFDFPRFGSLF